MYYNKIYHIIIYCVYQAIKTSFYVDEPLIRRRRLTRYNGGSSVGRSDGPDVHRSKRVNALAITPVKCLPTYHGTVFQLHTTCNVRQ